MKIRQYPPDWCSAREMAYLLSMSESTFRSNVAAHLLPQPVAVNGKTLWSRAAMNEHLEEKQNPGWNGPNSEDMKNRFNGATAKTPQSA